MITAQLGYTVPFMLDALKNREDVTHTQETHNIIVFFFLLSGLCGCATKHQSPEWTILSHVNCLIQDEVFGFQVLLDSLHPRSIRVSWWSPPVLQGEAVKIFLTSVQSGIKAM